MRRLFVGAAFLLASAAPCFADGAPDGAYESAGAPDGVYEPAAAPDERGVYAALRAGAVFLTEEDIPGFAEYNTGFAVLIAGGYAFGNGFAVEGEFSYRGINVGGFVDGNIDFYNFMANALYEFPLGPVRPYVGGGVGLGIVAIESDPLGVDRSEEGFAWQAIGGFAFPVSGRTDVVIDYRYGSTHDEGNNLAHHNVTGGVRMRF